MIDRPSVGPQPGHFTIALRDYEGTHIIWTDPDGGEHRHSWSNPNESNLFIQQWVARWRREYSAAAANT